MKRTAIILCVIVLFSFGCKKDIVLYRNVIPQDIAISIHEIQTDYSQELYIDKVIKKTQRSTSWHIGGGYLVTAAHCVVFDKTPVRTPMGTIQYVPIKTFDYLYTRNDHKIELIGAIDDTALLYDNLLIGTPSIVWGDSSKARVGTELILVGNSMMNGVNIKTGIISIIEIPKPLFGLHERTAKASFVMTTPTNGGDSGGPIFAISNGKHYVIGMCYAGSNKQGYNIAFKSNYIRMVIEEIKSKATAVH